MLSVTFSFVPIVRPFFVPLLVKLMAGADVGNTSRPRATSQAYDVSVVWLIPQLSRTHVWQLVLKRQAFGDANEP